MATFHSRTLKLQQYHLSQIRESSNNRLVDIGDSMLALLSELPPYGGKSAEPKLTIMRSSTEKELISSRPQEKSDA